MQAFEGMSGSVVCWGMRERRAGRRLVLYMYANYCFLWREEIHGVFLLQQPHRDPKKRVNVAM